MSSARDLLDLAAEYVDARNGIDMARAHGTLPVADLDEIAGRFETALRGFVGGVAST